MIYKTVKYKGKWSVYDTRSRVYYFIGQGRLFCMQKAMELNKEEHQS